MKVSITQEMKKFITVYEMPTVRKIIEAMKEDESTAKEYAEQAARIASGSYNAATVFEAKAEIAKNRRVWNDLTEDSGDFDIWITFTAFASGEFEGFVMGGAYLTDIWKAYGDVRRDAELRKHMYIRKFTETK